MWADRCASVASASTCKRGDMSTMMSWIQCPSMSEAEGHPFFGLPSKLYRPHLRRLEIRSCLISLTSSLFSLSLYAPAMNMLRQQETMSMRSRTKRLWIINWQYLFSCGPTPHTGTSQTTQTRIELKLPYWCEPSKSQTSITIIRGGETERYFRIQIKLTQQ